MIVKTENVHHRQDFGRHDCSWNRLAMSEQEYIHIYMLYIIYISTIKININSTTRHLKFGYISILTNLLQILAEYITRIYVTIAIILYYYVL